MGLGRSPLPGPWLKRQFNGVAMIRLVLDYKSNQRTILCDYGVNQKIVHKIGKANNCVLTKEKKGVCGFYGLPKIELY